MKIAVIGCGAIGSIFLGKLCRQAGDVFGVVRDYQKEPLFEQGLKIRGIEEFDVSVKSGTALREKPDLVILAVKINDIEEALSRNKEYLKDAYILTTENGIRADYIVSKFIPEEKIITGIVLFGATFSPPNTVTYNFQGPVVLGSIFEKNVGILPAVKDLLAKSFDVVVEESIKGPKYLKVFVNLNNCIPAVLGVSMQDAFSDLRLARLAVMLNEEAYEIVDKSGVKLKDLPGYPVSRVESLVSMPVDAAAGIFSQVMASLSKEPLYGSILQSIKRGRPSEIDYINGEIVRLAEENNLPAPLNKKITDMVHKVETGGKFFAREELLKAFGIS